MKLTIYSNNVFWFSILAVIFSHAAAVSAATPTVEQALALTPIQQSVDYDRPAP